MGCMYNGIKDGMYDEIGLSGGVCGGVRNICITESKNITTH